VKYRVYIFKTGASNRRVSFRLNLAGSSTNPLYLINFGDSLSDNQPVSIKSFTAMVSHVFATNDIFNVSISVFNRVSFLQKNLIVNFFILDF
jgi:hypothetical protein